MNAVDTNILIYLSDSRELAKRPVAASLVRSLPDGVLLWQVACEYIAASRKLSAVGYTQAQDFDDIGTFMRTWPTAIPTLEVLSVAQNLLQRYSLSFWDANLVAACQTAGVRRLYTEDFSGYPKIGDVEIVNPFA